MYEKVKDLVKLTLVCVAMYFIVVSAEKFLLIYEFETKVNQLSVSQDEYEFSFYQCIWAADLKKEADSSVCYGDK